ncbi:TPA: hypothetical protein LA462_003503 [Clostridium botulinum]|nr:hypothetical protein [Clostridium botulinum]
MSALISIFGIVYFVFNLNKPYKNIKVIAEINRQKICTEISNGDFERAVSTMQETCKIVGKDMGKIVETEYTYKLGK